MPGRKGEKRERKGGRGSSGNDNLASLLGLSSSMPPGVDDDDLEAELLALEGKSPSKKEKAALGTKKAGVMSLDQIGSLVAGLKDVGDCEGDGDEESDIDEDELMGELEELAGTSDHVYSTTDVAKADDCATSSVASSDISTISSRMEMYQDALAAAQKLSESLKVRRYNRCISTLNSMLKQAKNGKKVDLDDLPPVVHVGVKNPADSQAQKSESKDSKDQKSQEATNKPIPKPRQKTQPEPKTNLIDLNAPEFDEFNISEEEMAALALQMEKGQSEDKTSAVPAKRPRVQKEAPSLKSSGKSRQPHPETNLIDLNAPEFDEFNLSEDEIAALALQMNTTPSSSTDERAGVAPHLSEQQDTLAAFQPPKASTPTVTQSLPAKIAESPTKDITALVLAERKQQYSAVMKQAKAEGNSSKQKEYGKMCISFDRVLKAVEEGKDVDLSQMPGPPPGYTSKYKLDLSKIATLAKAPVNVQENTPATDNVHDPSSETDSTDPEIAVPKTVIEALEQRLVKYRSGVESAQKNSEASRVRRLGRIVKQYEEAIKANKAGRTVDYSELPCPPGYPPIPVQKTQRVANPMPISAKPTQSLPVAKISSGDSRSPIVPSISQQQLHYLLARKDELRKAAKEEQEKGNKRAVMQYIQYYKGVDQMIEAARSGLPVDMTQVPPSPYEALASTKPAEQLLSHLKPASEADAKTFNLIEAQLEKQIKICDTNAEVYENLGNIGTSLQYKNMSQNIQKELLAIKSIQVHGLAPPKFTTESRKFVIVKSNLHLSSEHFEVDIARAIDLPHPTGYDEKDLNVYIEVEFPWPSDNPQKISTPRIKGMSSPEFKSSQLFNIDRHHIRSLQRAFKRNPIKFTLWQSRTLRRDLFIGQCQASLEGLDNKCQVNLCLNLMDDRNRKQVGGKLEVAMRLRDPLTGKDQEEKEEQRLVFQEQIVGKSAVSMPSASKSTSPQGKSNGQFIGKIENTTSMEALKLEYSIVQRLQKSGTNDAAVSQRARQIQARMAGIKQRLQSDPAFKHAYPQQVASELKQERKLEQQYWKAGLQTETKVTQLRIKMMEKELKF